MKKTIQSIDRALDILEFISESGNKSRILDISTHLNLKTTTVHSLVKTLENRGYLIRDLKTPKYSLGLNCMRLGIIYRRDFFAREKMHKFLIRLSEEIGETAFFIVRVGNQYFHLDAIAPDKSIKADAEVGVFKNIENNCPISKIFTSLDPDLKYDMKNEESEDEINCLAIPFKENNRLVGVIAFKGPTYRFKTSNMIKAYNTYLKNLE